MKPKKKFTTPFDRFASNKPDTDTVRISISSWTFVKALVILAIATFLWLIKDVVGLVFVALVFASALDPFVDKLARYRIPRSLSIFGLYVFILGFVGVLFSVLVPAFVHQLSGIAGALTTYAPNIDALYQYVTQSSDASIVQQFQQGLVNVTNLSSGLFTTVSGAFGTAATTITAVLLVLMITFYMTVEEDAVKKFVRSIAPIHLQPYLVQKTNRIQEMMGAWLRGQLIVMLVIGTASFVGLWALDVPYALVLAGIAGLFEFLPFIGPILAAVPAVFFAATDSPWKAVAVIVLYVVIQQLENQLIVPKIMQRVVGLSPIVVIVAMLIGAKVAGVAGILLAVPATTIGWIFIEDIFVKKKEMDNQLETHNE